MQVGRQGTARSLLRSVELTDQQISQVKTSSSLHSLDLQSPLTSPPGPDESNQSDPCQLCPLDAGSNENATANYYPPVTSLNAPSLTAKPAPFASDLDKTTSKNLSIFEPAASHAILTKQKRPEMETHKPKSFHLPIYSEKEFPSLAPFQKMLFHFS